MCTGVSSIHSQSGHKKRPESSRNEAMVAAAPEESCVARDGVASKERRKGRLLVHGLAIEESQERAKKEEKENTKEVRVRTAVSHV